MKRILPKLLAVLTRHNRYLVTVGEDFEWSHKSWTHNAFRCYELLFGRRDGVRIEMSAKLTGGKVTYHCHTWESVFALAEQYVREWLESRKFVPFKIYIPVLQTPSGERFFASPYLFAVAIDTHVLKLPAATAQSFTYTATGSLLSMVAFVWRAGTTAASATPTYNLVNMAAITAANTSSAATNASLTPWSLIAPATGANTWACSNPNDAAVITFTGTSQTSQPDSSNKVNNEGSETNTTLTVTTVSDNCMAVTGFGNSTATTPSAGAGSTLLDQELSSLFATTCSNSTNPITPAGNYSMTTNHNASGGNYMSIIAVAPPGAANTAKSITSDLVIFN